MCKESRDRFLAKLEVHVIPCVANGRMSLAEITEHLGQSCYGKSPAEGVYLRYDDGGWLGQRAKLVRRDFIQAIELHWSRRPLEINRLATTNETY